MKTGWISGVTAAVFLVGGILVGMTVFDNGTQTPKKADTLGGIVVEAHAATVMDYGRNYVPDITTRSVYGNTGKVWEILSKLQNEMKKGEIKKIKKLMKI